MKKLLLVFILSFFLQYYAYPVRIIQISDIVNWCVESELIITGRVIKLDTIQLETIITKIDAQWNSHCLSGREEYYIEIDSVLKGDCNLKAITVYTPKTCLAHSEQSVNTNTVSVRQSYYDNSWYRLKEGENLIIILDQNSDKYEVLYRMEQSEDNNSLITDINREGRDYKIFRPTEQE